MADYVKEMRELIGSRPFIMVGSTVLALNEEKHILFQLRTDTLKWGLPGGAMEIGESLKQTAVRELFEETGLTAIDLNPIDVLSGQELYCDLNTILSHNCFSKLLSRNVKHLLTHNDYKVTIVNL